MLASQGWIRIDRELAPLHSLYGIDGWLICPAVPLWLFVLMSPIALIVGIIDPESVHVGGVTAAEDPSLRYAVLILLIPSGVSASLLGLMKQRSVHFPRVVQTILGFIVAYQLYLVGEEFLN